MQQRPKAYPERVVGFVPDHLGFGSHEGVDIFKAQASGLESFLAIRSPRGACYSQENAAGVGGSCDRILDIVRVTPQNGPEQQFELWTQDEMGSGVLVQNRGKTHPEGEVVFRLPFAAKSGFLTSSEVSYADAEHTILVLSARDATNERSFLWVFDISDPEKPLEPFLTDAPENFLISARPTVFKTAEAGVGIALGGSSGQAGAIRFVFLNESRTSEQLTVGGEALSFIVAASITQQAFVERLYVADSNHLWAVAISDLSHVSPCLLAEAAISAMPQVVLDGTGPGVRLYFLGTVLQTQGLWMLQDDLQTQHKHVLPEQVLSGDYNAVVVRFGRLLLIPAAFHSDPLVINLPDHLQLPVVWRSLGSMGVVSNEQERVRFARVLWDPEEQREVLWLISQGCQLNLWTARPHADKYGRNAWRKTK